MKTILASLIITLLTCINCYAGFVKLNHQVQDREDGGFTIIITGTIRHLKPITSEGFFPKESVNYQIELIGDGENWTYRNQPGFYYSLPENIISKKTLGDFGYAWIDEKKENIYLNFYWVNSPDSFKEFNINGKYEIKK